MKIKKLLYYGLIIILLIVFIVSGYHVVDYLLASNKQQTQLNDLAAIVEQGKTQSVPESTMSSDDTGNLLTPDSTEETQVPMLPEYAPIYEMNSDLVGWLKIEDTPINYPVMQTPEEKDYYLYRNFYREHSIFGCLYAREDCDINTPSDNITIYGHHMTDGSMFAGLDSYLKKEFWETHSTITFDTLTEHHTYKIFAVFRTTASIGMGFTYHQFVDAADEAEFLDFVMTCKQLAEYDTGVFPEYGDKMICLSTCEYTRENGRLVVAAVRID